MLVFVFSTDTLIVHKTLLPDKNRWFTSGVVQYFAETVVAVSQKISLHEKTTHKEVFSGPEAIL
jgi:hypothetical protein